MTQKAQEGEMTPRMIGAAMAALALAACGGDDVSGLGCPAGTQALTTEDMSVRWCARADGTAHGPYQELDAAGQVRVLGQFADGLADGLWQGFDALGNLRFEHHFDPYGACGTWWDEVGGGREHRELRPCADDGRGHAPDPSLRAPKGVTPWWDGERCDGEVRAGDDGGSYALYCYVGAETRSGPFARWADAGRAVLLAEGSYVDDALDGPHRTYWPDTGGLKSEGAYSGGAKTGEWRFYDADGWPLEIGSYQGGVRTGAWTAYYPAGPWRATTEWAGGVRHGTERRYYADGAPAEDVTWAAGRRDGAYKRWHVGGLGLAVRGTYEDERRAGVWTEYARNGTKVSEGAYAHGVRQGDWATWTHQGAPVTAGAYDEGVAVGEWTIWSDQGDLRIAYVGAMVGGVAHGTWVGTWSTGAPYDEVEYVHGSREGAYAAYWPNGNPFTEGTFVNDRPQGPWRFWDEDGELVGEATYQQGEVVDGWGEVL